MATRHGVRRHGARLRAGRHGEKRHRCNSALGETARCQTKDTCPFGTCRARYSVPSTVFGAIIGSHPPPLLGLCDFRYFQDFLRQTPKNRSGWRAGNFRVRAPPAPAPNTLLFQYSEITEIVKTIGFKAIQESLGPPFFRWSKVVQGGPRISWIAFKPIVFAISVISES